VSWLFFPRPAGKFNRLILPICSNPSLTSKLVFEEMLLEDNPANLMLFLFPYSSSLSSVNRVGGGVRGGVGGGVWWVFSLGFGVWGGGGGGLGGCSVLILHLLAFLEGFFSWGPGGLGGGGREGREAGLGWGRRGRGGAGVVEIVLIERVAFFLSGGLGGAWGVWRAAEGWPGRRGGGRARVGRVRRGGFFGLL